MRTLNMLGWVTVYAIAGLMVWIALAAPTADPEILLPPIAVPAPVCTHHAVTDFAPEDTITWTNISIEVRMIYGVREWWTTGPCD